MQGKYKIDTGVSETNGQFWNNFFTRYTGTDATYRLVSGQSEENKEHFVIGFKENDSGNVYLVLSPGTTEDSVKPTADRKQRKESEKYIKEKGLKHIYYDHSHPHGPVPSSEDLTHVDVGTKRGRKPVHCVTFNAPSAGTGKLIYQRKNYPNILSRTLSRLSNRTGVRRPFMKRFERKIEDKLKGAISQAEYNGIKLGMGDILPMVAEELENTDKYNSDWITVGEEESTLPANFEKFGF